MSRPLYEATGEFSDGEISLKGHVETGFGLKLHKLPRSFVFDYAGEEGGGLVQSVFEVKCRSHKISDYKTVIVSAHKMIAASRFIALKIAPILAFSFAGERYYHRIDAEPYDFRMGGRVDRGDPADIELVAHIPIGEWQRF